MQMIEVIDNMGAEIIEKSLNRIVVKMPLQPNKNHVGMMYAGSLFTLAEFPAGVLMVENIDITKVYPVVAEMSIKYKKPAFTDITMTLEIPSSEFKRLEDEAIAEGKSKLIIEQELIDDTGDVVAVTTARYVCLKAG
jgi:thioesterase domain-containing protein